MRNPSLLLFTTLTAALLSACTADVDGPEDLGDEAAHEEDSDAIVGGTNQNITSHPWQISLQSSSGGHFCGGSILNASWILTAQHCIATGNAFEVSAPGTMRIAAGSSTLSGMSTSGQIRQIEQVIPYPGYVDTDEGKDVALIKLSTPLTLNTTTVKAIALATAADASAGLLNVGVTANVSGWGTLSSGGSSPNTLQAVNVPIVSNATAGSLYGMTISSDQLPAGDTVNGGEDSCQGDSGGPLTVAKGSGRILAGVVSWGNGCADKRWPGLYARVTSFQSWITDVIGSPFTLAVNQANQAGSSGTWKHFTVTVPAGAQGLAAYVTNGTSASGDVDLYVRQGSQPTTSSYACTGQNNGHYEACVIPTPAAGTWYVSLRGYNTYKGASLTAYTFQ
ncbi:trypsin-like serine protease [Chondromyces apiculatus]|uniref:Vibriolysin, extracellular zinc protease n=1 Tax=Chondromyces apiculatus DSM 436 TaxID=1192034 RepID=A0A017THI9_9BACT|nr:trypsin-like serine protease [Chondromyces apiculatus]EYF08748.1 Vibriolysin, extracellular zinc protease [Chondromyces apiculatus DSM 436]